MDEDTLDAERELLADKRANAKQAAIAFLIVGVVLIVLGVMALAASERGRSEALFYIFFILWVFGKGCISVVVGACAVLKGNSPAYALLDFCLCTLIGLLVVVCLPDHTRLMMRRIDRLLADKAGASGGVEDYY